MKRRYKVLPLPTWVTPPRGFEFSREECLERRTPAEPVFRRDGFYLDRKTRRTWLEYDGKAWESDEYAWFLYELDHSNGSNRLEDHVYRAIGVLLTNRLGDRRLEKLHAVETQMRALRRITVEARRGARAMRRRFEELVAGKRAKRKKG